MTVRQTQLDIIRMQIDEKGYVSRNWCSSRFITRLGARIIDLKREGYQFVTRWEGGDYVYVATNMPAPKQPALLASPNI